MTLQVLESCPLCNGEGYLKAKNGELNKFNEPFHICTLCGGHGEV